MNRHSIKKLNLGSGFDKKIDDSWIHIDSSPLGKPDYVCDITKGIPDIKDNTIGFVKADNIMEHLGDDFINVMKELHRVCTNGAVMWIRVPHVDGPGAFQDPTHNKFFNEITFLYFDHRQIHWKNYGRLYGIPKFEIILQTKDKIYLVIELKVIK